MKKHLHYLGALPAVLWLTSAVLTAQPAPGPDDPSMPPPPEQFSPEGPGQDDPLRQHLFPPETILRSARQINLTEAQRTALKDLAMENQRLHANLRWDLRECKDKLEMLLEKDTVDESAARAQLAKILDLENQLKKAHFESALKIRALLTPEQLKTLRALPPGRPARPFHKMDAGPGPNRKAMDRKP